MHFVCLEGQLGRYNKADFVFLMMSRIEDVTGRKRPARLAIAPCLGSIRSLAPGGATSIERVPDDLVRNSRVASRKGREERYVSALPLMPLAQAAATLNPAETLPEWFSAEAGHG